MNRCLFLFCWLISPVGILAQSPEIIILSDTTLRPPVWNRPEVQYFLDSAGTIDFRAVRRPYIARRFRASTDSIARQTFTFPAHWIRFRVRNEAKTPMAWVVGNIFPLVRFYEFYLVDEQTGRVVRRVIGQWVPGNNRAIDTHNLAFPLNVLPGHIYTVYLHAMGKEAKKLVPFVAEQQRYYNGYQRESWGWGIYLGIFAGMILFQSVFLITTRQKNFTFYILYLLSFLLAEIQRGNGFIGNRYLWADATWFKQYGLVVAGTLSIIFGALFYADGLRLKQHAIWLYRLMLVDIAYVTLSTVYVLIYAGNQNMVMHSMKNILVSDLLVLVYCVVVYRKGYHPARFYLLATLSFLTGIVITGLWAVGYFPYRWWTVNALNIATLVEMLFFTGALADEYLLTRKTREQAQQQLIDNLQTQNREISAALLRGQTVERQRVAVDLHDNLGTTLSVLQWTLAGLDKRALTPTERDVYQTLRQMLDRAYTDVRLLAHNLLPAHLAEQGLGVALQQLVKRFNAQTNVYFSLTLPAELPRLDPQTEFELYSICLELANNTLKHAQATQSDIHVELIDNQLKFRISDNGIGLSAGRTEGRGLQNVRARVEAVGAEWQVETASGAGVQHQITVPLTIPAHAA
jgi:two-component system, sensor histidine kinase LadS